tara:strand:- start:317 stop:496 length:180 start_codon:yes stop_codon:yes gene_type:complete
MRVENNWQNRKDLAIEVVDTMTLEELRQVTTDYLIDLYESHRELFANDWVMYYMDEKTE